MFTLWMNVFDLVTVMWLTGLFSVIVSSSYKMTPLDAKTDRNQRSGQTRRKFDSVMTNEVKQYRRMSKGTYRRTSPVFHHIGQHPTRPLRGIPRHPSKAPLKSSQLLSNHLTSKANPHNTERLPIHQPPPHHLQSKRRGFLLKPTHLLVTRPSRS